MRTEHSFGNILTCPECHETAAIEAHPGNWRCEACGWGGMLYRERVAIAGWPEAYPGERVDRARESLEAYAESVGLDLVDDALETVMGDLIADLLHIAAAEQVEFSWVLSAARRHFEAEHDSPSPSEDSVGAS